MKRFILLFSVCVLSLTVWSAATGLPIIATAYAFAYQHEVEARDMQPPMQETTVLPGDWSPPHVPDPPYTYVGAKKSYCSVVGIIPCIVGVPETGPPMCRTTIQDAIDYVESLGPRGTVFVPGRTAPYVERLRIRKHVSLIGQNPTDVVIQFAAGSPPHPSHLSPSTTAVIDAWNVNGFPGELAPTDAVEIKNITVQSLGSGGRADFGILMWAVNSEISCNIIVNSGTSGLLMNAAPGIPQSMNFEEDWRSNDNYVHHNTFATNGVNNPAQGPDPDVVVDSPDSIGFIGDENLFAMNTVTDVPGNAVVSWGGINNDFINNVLTNVGRGIGLDNCLDLNPGNGPCEGEGESNRIVRGGGNGVHGNIISNAVIGVATWYENVEGWAGRSVISGNTIAGTARSVSIGASHRIDVMDNIFTSPRANAPDVVKVDGHSGMQEASVRIGLLWNRYEFCGASGSHAVFLAPLSSQCHVYSTEQFTTSLLYSDVVDDDGVGNVVEPYLHTSCP
jgi:hypothetical protein